MLIYLAGPFFNKAERNFNLKIAEKLRDERFEVWLPQEHPFIQGPSLRERKRIYETDLQALKKSDVVVAVLDGVEVDSGTAFEIGYANALNKPIIGLKTDYRTFSSIENVNLMLEASLVKICKNVEEVITVIKKTKL